MFFGAPGPFQREQIPCNRINEGMAIAGVADLVHAIREGSIPVEVA